VVDKTAKNPPELQEKESATMAKCLYLFGAQLIFDDLRSTPGKSVYRPSGSALRQVAWQPPQAVPVSHDHCYGIAFMEIEKVLAIANR